MDRLVASIATKKTNKREFKGKKSQQPLKRLRTGLQTENKEEVVLPISLGRGAFDSSVSPKRTSSSMIEFEGYSDINSSDRDSKREVVLPIPLGPRYVSHTSIPPVIFKDKFGSVLSSEKSLLNKHLETLKLMGKHKEFIGVNSVDKDSIEKSILKYIKSLNDEELSSIIDCSESDADDRTRTMLMNASVLGFYELAKCLCEKGANIHIVDGTSANALLLAIAKKNIDIASILIDHKANVDAANKEGFTPLILAVIHKDIDLVRKLLKNDANINYHGESVSTALIRAVLLDCKSDDDVLLKNTLIQCLLDKDADPKIGGKGFTALSYAAHFGKSEALMCILNKDIDIIDYRTGTKHATPLMYAVNAGHYDLATKLIEKGANINATLDDGTTILQLLLAKKEFLHSSAKRTLLSKLGCIKKTKKDIAVLEDMDDEVLELGEDLVHTPHFNSKDEKKQQQLKDTMYGLRHICSSLFP